MRATTVVPTDTIDLIGVDTVARQSTVNIGGLRAEATEELGGNATACS